MVELTGNEIPNNVSSCGNEVLLAFSSLYDVSSGYSGKLHVIDAIQKPEIGSSGFCTFGCLCGANEGPCDSNEQCKHDHLCLLCPSSLGFPEGTNCCHDVNCGLASLENGILVSPNYPGNYKKHLECHQQLSTRAGEIIFFEFIEFNVSI